MVIIDSSVLIALFRKRDRPLGQSLTNLVLVNKAAICGQVWVEYLGGFRKVEVRREQGAYLKEFPWIDTPKSAYELAAEMLAAEPKLGAGDAIIAATVAISKSYLFTTDKDFNNLGRFGVKLFDG